MYIYIEHSFVLSRKSFLIMLIFLVVLYTDYWQEYICAVTSLLQRRWKQLSEHLVCEVSLENVWVIPRVMSRAKERPDQTPGSAGKGSKAGKHELLI